MWLYNITRICNKIKFHALSSVAELRNKMKKIHVIERNENENESPTNVFTCTIT